MGGNWGYNCLKGVAIWAFAIWAAIISARLLQTLATTTQAATPRRNISAELRNLLRIGINYLPQPLMLKVRIWNAAKVPAALIFVLRVSPKIAYYIFELNNVWEISRYLS